MGEKRMTSSGCLLISLGTTCTHVLARADTARQTDTQRTLMLSNDLKGIKQRVTCPDPALIVFQAKREGDRQKGAPTTKQTHTCQPTIRTKQTPFLRPPTPWSQVEGPLFPLGRETECGMAGRLGGRVLEERPASRS